MGHEEAIRAIRAQGGTDADVEAYLRSVGAVQVSGPPTGLSERELVARAKAREATNAAEREALNTPATTVMNFLDAGTFGLAGLAQDALSKGSFRANRDARRMIYESIPTGERIALGVAGGLTNPVRSFFGPAKSGAGLLRVAGKGVVEGAAQGAAQGFGENVGTSSGALAPTLVGAAGGALAGGLLAPAGRAIAARAEEAMNPTVRYIPDILPGATIPRGQSVPQWRASEKAGREAAERLLRANEADRLLGHAAPAARHVDGGPDLMALDVAGPTATAQARGAARSVGGYEALRGPLDARAERMASTITGDVQDAVALGNKLRAERSRLADIEFERAIEVTKGQPIETPSLDALRETPTGRAAWQAVISRRPDRVLGTGDPSRALPVVQRPVPGRVRGLISDLTGEPEVVERTVPDAEAIHEMTRQLRQWAKGEKGQVFPEGVDAISAGDALRLLERAKAELPEPFRIAVDNYAERSRPIDALELGRTPWKVNPKPSRRALPMADVKERVAGMTPEERSMVRTGKQFDIATRVSEGSLSPAKAVEKMRRPGSSLAQEFDLVGGPLPERLRAWDAAIGRQKAVLPSTPPAQGEGPTGLLGESGRDLAPSLWWTLTKGVRNRLISHGIKASEVTDAAFGKLMTGTPEEVNRTIAELARQHESIARDAALLSGKGSRGAARPSGLLSP